MTSLLASEVKHMNEIISEYNREDLICETLNSILELIKIATTQIVKSDCAIYESDTKAILNLTQAYGSLNDRS